jgi:hypothetical protein
VRRLIEAVTKIPRAVQVAPIDEPETHWTRALVTPARAKLAGAARLHKIVCERGCLAGTDWWWLDEQGLLCVVPANTTMAVTVEARAHAAAGEGLSRGCRVPTVRHGQGKPARTARLTTEVVGITGLTTDDQDGTAEPRRHAHRRDFQPNLRQAVVVRQWHGRDYGPGGKTVFLTHAAVPQPWQPFDDDADRSLLEHGCMKEATPPWELGHPPQNRARAVRVPVVFTRLMLALATADRRLGEPAATGGEPVGWQRWRRQGLEHTRHLVSVFAHGAYGILHLAEYSRLSGVKLKDVPPGIGTLPEILAKYRLRVHG